MCPVSKVPSHYYITAMTTENIASSRHMTHCSQTNTNKFLICREVSCHIVLTVFSWRGSRGSRGGGRAAAWPASRRGCPAPAADTPGTQQPPPPRCPGPRRPPPRRRWRPWSRSCGGPWSQDHKCCQLWPRHCFKTGLSCAAAGHLAPGTRTNQSRSCTPRSLIPRPCCPHWATCAACHV